MTTARPYRSIVKAATWRVVGSLDTMVLAWIVTWKFHLAFTIGGMEVFTKMALYYFHERAWNKVHWGKSKLEIDI